MEEQRSKVTLHGMWVSTYSKKVEIALKLKGILYEYVEEDLQNKSESLIQLNPVHKKIPVLVHNGKPVAESLVILEYIDETWKNSPRFFPEDPYERAQVRFWVSYINQQVFEVMGQVVFQEGEAQAKSVEEARKRVQVLEEGLKKHFPNKNIRENDDVGLLEITIIATFGAHKAYREALGVEIIDPVNTPTLYNWIERLQDLTVMKEVEVPRDKLVNFLQNYRQKLLQQAASA
ncbi:PREDICTED: glutathione S-transferase U10 isoform X2 [Camelina sativa]|uniref:Glutathione S-transferase n=1 Tax=Camelina sativa TaxID=90675 RepID=A0ABM0TM95_CAMSA|nr:PREDICTED: glutathione S-transferase U10 isoform X1 [Camelina sativa]XP_010428449.1 PREDICTED: glutathione S-transferase U10 isoform X2 [Camelina sativa]